MIYLDSAIATEASEALGWGWVKGITTNPTLLAKSDTDPATTLQTLASLTTGEVFYQLVSQTPEAMFDEAAKAREILGDQLVLKIPATCIGLSILPYLSEHTACSVTAIYQPTQALIAAEGGAKYAIAYVNRATRLQGDGCALVSTMKEILRGSKTTILAASLKSAAEISAAVIAGADHITVPFALLKTMTTHSLSEQTITDFTANGRGLT